DVAGHLTQVKISEPHARLDVIAASPAVLVTHIGRVAGDDKLVPARHRHDLWIHVQGAAPLGGEGHPRGPARAVVTAVLAVAIDTVRHAPASLTWVRRGYRDVLGYGPTVIGLCPINEAPIVASVIGIVVVRLALNISAKPSYRETRIVPGWQTRAIGRRYR